MRHCCNRAQTKRKTHQSRVQNLAGQTVLSEAALTQRGEAVRRALALGPDLAEAHIRAAQHYWETGNTNAAAEHHRRAMQLEPGNPLVLTHSAGIAAWRGRLDEAIELAQRAVITDPVAAIQRGNLGGYLLAAGRYEEAEREFRKEIELNPTLSVELDPMLGFIRILQRRFDDALSMT